jgi:phosphotransferase system enzyme I (PtsI)
MNAANISRVKRIMRQVKYTEVQQILENLLTLATADEVATALEGEMRQRYPQVFAERYL